MNNFTEENTKEATHKIGSYFKKIIPGNMPEFLSKDGVWLLSSFSVKSALTHKSLIELSRPIGEREEDHTIDGILKKAQPQGAKAYEVALMIEALDDNPDEQVIEPYVADQLNDLINPVSEGCQAGDPPLTVEQHQEILDDLAENDKPVRIGSPVEPYEWTEKHDEQLKSAMVRVEQLNKPVFTQEMEKAGELPPVGCEVGYNTASRGDIVDVVTGYRTWKSLNTLADNCGYRVFVTFEHNERLLKDVWPIDNRTDKEKLSDAVYKVVGEMPKGSDWKATCATLLASDKFTITLNKG